MTIILAGTIGQSGLGGQAWATLQYLLGFRALGHDVYYLEDCGDSSWVYDWEKGEWTTDVAYPAGYVSACLKPFGFDGKWIYRTSEESCGLSLSQFLEVCRRADLFIMRAVPIWVWRKEYDQPKRRAFLDVDPGFTQRNIANGDQGLASGVARCERRFTIGQRIGSVDCLIENVGGPWLPTRPPVFLDEWPVTGGGARDFTSVIRWQGISVFKEENSEQSQYGQRDKEFPKFINLPNLTSQTFRLALLGTDTSVLTDCGWLIDPGEVISKTPDSYRAFIQNSRAEFSVPKHGYIATRGGWFSDRSVCYLASGKPVLMEDTGVSNCLASGMGLILFQNLNDAVAGVEEINRDYHGHCRAARSLAESYFATGKVLPPLLEAAMK
jgi:hypothetical protein